MNLREFIEWVNTLPKEFMEYDIVAAELGVIDEEYHYRLDKPITALNVDEETKEILFLHEMDDDKKEDN